MKRLLITLLLATVSIATINAQESDNKQIYKSKDGDNSISAADDGSMVLIINGLRFKIDGYTADHIENSDIVPNDDRFAKRNSRAHFGIFGLGSPSYNHLALIEAGSSLLVGEEYSGYSAEEQEAMAFDYGKSSHFTANLMHLNVALDRRNISTFTIGFGMSSDYYRLKHDVTLGYADGKLHAIALDGDAKKSKLITSYLNFPVLFDVNMGKGFFISAGARFNVLINSMLKYKNPKTTVEGTLPLNPIQVDIMARIGWKRLYVFANYSPMSLYKSSTGVKANRMSIGAGIWF